MIFNSSKFNFYCYFSIEIVLKQRKVFWGNGNFSEAIILNPEMILNNFHSKEKYERPEIDYHLRKKVISEGQTLGLGCVEGAFFNHAVPCPIDINSPDYIPLMLFMQYLTQLEGPFWRQLRGQGNCFSSIFWIWFFFNLQILQSTYSEMTFFKGLTYGYNMFIRLNEQLLYFTLYRATNVVAAFKQFKTITVSMNFNVQKSFKN